MDSQDDATRQACTHVFKSALRQYRYNLRKTHFEGKANSELAQTSLVENISDEDGEASLNTGPIRSIRYIIYMSSDHMLKSYLRM